MRFQVIIRGRNCKKYISACLKSLLKQSYANWMATVVLDAPTDDSEKVAFKYVDERISVHVNKKRLGLSANIWNGIKLANAKPEDIVVIFDADDELDKGALKTVAKAYEKRPTLLATHGSYRHIGRKRRTKISKAYSKKKSVRKQPWRGSHLKTFKYKLMDYFPKSYLKDKKGKWYMASSDIALMIPILELAGLDRTKFISKIIYKWRKTPDTIYKNKKGYRLQQKNKKEIYAKKPLKRVEF